MLYMVDRISDGNYKILNIKVMKNKFVLLLLLAGTLSTTAATTDTTSCYTPRAKFDFDVLPFFVSTLKLGGEFDMTNRSSLYIAPSFKYIDQDYEKEEGYAIELQLRRYVYQKLVTKHSKQLYFGLYGRFQYSRLEYEEYVPRYPDEYDYQMRTTDLRAVSLGVLVGLQYVFAENVFLDFYAGGGLRKASDNAFDSYSVFDAGYSGFTPKAGITIGFGN
jgi:hypothetical protein